MVVTAKIQLLFAMVTCSVLVLDNTTSAYLLLLVMALLLLLMSVTVITAVHVAVFSGQWQWRWRHSQDTISRCWSALKDTEISPPVCSAASRTVDRVSVVVFCWLLLLLLLSSSCCCCCCSPRPRLVTAVVVALLVLLLLSSSCYCCCCCSPRPVSAVVVALLVLLLLSSSCYCCCCCSPRPVIALLVLLLLLLLLSSSCYCCCCCSPRPVIALLVLLLLLLLLSSSCYCCCCYCSPRPVIALLVLLLLLLLHSSFCCCCCCSARPPPPPLASFASHASTPIIQDQWGRHTSRINAYHTRPVRSPYFTHQRLSYKTSQVAMLHASTPVLQDRSGRHASRRAQEQCESWGGRPGLSVLMSLTVSVDVKQHWTMLRHWSQFSPNMSTDIRGHDALLRHVSRMNACPTRPVRSPCFMHQRLSHKTCQVALRHVSKSVCSKIHVLPIELCEEEALDDLPWNIHVLPIELWEDLPSKDNKRSLSQSQWTWFALKDRHVFISYNERNWPWKDYTGPLSITMNVICLEGTTRLKWRQRNSFSYTEYSLPRKDKHDKGSVTITAMCP